MEMTIEKNIYLVQPSKLTADEVHEIIEAAENAQVRAVLLKMESFELLNSSTLGRLVLLSRNLKERQIRFGVTNLSKQNLQLMKIGCLDLIFKIFENVDQGMEVFLQPSG